jgi:aminoglycoside phosphotransferase (APT) family kinase protein
MTASLTKHPLSEAQLEALVHLAFGPDTTVDSWSELTDGSYNSAFAVTLGGDPDDALVPAEERDHARELILKVAPSPDLRLLTHEVDLMRTEVDVYRRADQTSVGLPRTVYAGFDRTIIGTDFAFLSKVEGIPFDTVRDTMTAPELAQVRTQIATAATGLHAVTGEAYGYPLRGSRSWLPRWRDAFGAMVDDILDDAVRLRSILPMPPDRIRDLLSRHADLLDDVTRPALVHFDLWDGNVFVAPDPSTGWRVSGFIDGERALYGDPVAELVSLGLFRELDDATLAPFGELTDRDLRRLRLYTVYLYLIMAIEGATRGWDSPERQQYESWLRDRLLDKLATL